MLSRASRQLSACCNRKPDSRCECVQPCLPRAEPWFGHLLRALRVRTLKKDHRTDRSRYLNNCTGAQQKDRVKKLTGPPLPQQCSHVGRGSKGSWVPLHVVTWLKAQSDTSDQESERAVNFPSSSCSPSLVLAEDGREPADGEASSFGQKKSQLRCRICLQCGLCPAPHTHTHTETNMTRLDDGEMEIKREKERRRLWTGQHGGFQGATRVIQVEGEKCDRDK